MAGRFSVHAVFKLNDKMTAPIAKIEGRLSKMTRTASRELDRLDHGFSKIGKGMRHAGVVVAAGAASAAAGIAAVVKPALDLETAMAKVSTVISTTAGGSIPEALEKTKRAALDWSNVHTQSAEEFLEANYNMASAGLNSEQALAGTRAALTLATATLGDAATAGNLLATVYNNMGNKSADAGTEMMRLSDVLAKTQAVFQIADLSQLNESLKMGAPAAIQYGISVEQLSNAVGALNTAGLQGSQAGTSFAASMRNMLKASRALKFEIAKTESGGVDFAGTLDNIAAKYGSFEKMTDRQKLAFQKAFGDEGLRAISLLLGKTNEFNASLKAVTESERAAAKQQGQIESARGAALSRLGNQIHNVAGEFGEALLPALDMLKPLLDDTIKRVSSWIEANKGLVASKAAEYVERFIKALPEIFTWLERIAIGVAVFYGMEAAIKAARIATFLFNGVLIGVNALLTATAAGTTAAATGATGLGVALAGPALATAGLLTAALAVGVAIGSWLDHEFGISKMFEDWLVNLTGIEDTVNSIGRSNERGTGIPEAPAVPAVPTVGPQSFIPGAPGSEFFAPAPTPSVASPEERTARYYSEEHKTMTDELGVTIKDETGRAVVTKKPKRASLNMAHSGAM